MQIVVLASEAAKQEFAGSTDQNGKDIVWISDLGDVGNYYQADAFIDLMFVPKRDRITKLRQLLPRTVIINSVPDTLRETDENFIRINAWPTFLGAAIVEASAATEERRAQAEDILTRFGKKPEWLPDIPGFITPRVISMIINEAFFALQEGISTREEMNTAMKLGTNYPHGPFEWASLIGPEKINHLLRKLADEHPRYMPAPGMVD